MGLAALVPVGWLRPGPSDSPPNGPVKVAKVCSGQQIVPEAGVATRTAQALQGTFNLLAPEQPRAQRFTSGWWHQPRRARKSTPPLPNPSVPDSVPGCQSICQPQQMRPWPPLLCPASQTPPPPSADDYGQSVKAAGPVIISLTFGPKSRGKSLTGKIAAVLGGEKGNKSGEY